MQASFYTHSNCHEWRQIGVLPVIVRIVRHAHQTRYAFARRHRKGEG